MTGRGDGGATEDGAAAGDDVAAEGAVPNDDTVLRPGRDAAAGSPTARGVSPLDAVPLDNEDTIIRLIQPHAPARERLAQPSPPETEPLELIDSASTPPAAPAVSRVQWAARIRGTNVTIPLDRPAVIGRHPRPTRIDENPAPRRVQIPAAHRDVSGRHARLEQVGDTLVVTDLGSTNGIDVHWAEGPVRRLRPGETSVVLPDAVVALGDAVVIEFVVSTPN